MLTRLSRKENISSRRPTGSGYTSKVRVRDRYHIVGFISSGTYGRVYKALGKNGQKGEFAIKKLAHLALLRIEY
jgi:cyclin-dependent kinase 8/11